MTGCISQKVSDIIAENYQAASQKRAEHMLKVIDETLGLQESGVLFIREGHPLQFPTEIDIFSVSPPALDEIYRWVRDYNQQMVNQMSQKQEKAE